MALTTDRNDPRLREHDANGQQKAYLVLSEEERAKGFVRPVMSSYVHVACGTETQMGRALAETYAVSPKHYSGTFCSHCRSHFNLRDTNGQAAFLWPDGTPVGSTPEEAAPILAKIKEDDDRFLLESRKKRAVQLRQELDELIKLGIPEPPSTLP